MKRALLLPVLITAAAVTVSCSSGSDDAETTTTADSIATTVPTASTVPDDAVLTGLRELEQGQCAIAAEEGSDVSAVWVLPCESPHTYEVYALVAYDGEDGYGGADYPGVPTVQNWAEQACFDRFEAFVGIRWTLSELDIATWWPSEESWDRGDRTAICSVVSDTGDSLTGTQANAER